MFGEGVSGIGTTVTYTSETRSGMATLSSSRSTTMGVIPVPIGARLMVNFSFGIAGSVLGPLIAGFALLLGAARVLAAHEPTVVNGQIFTSGLAIVDAPAAGR